MEIEGSPSAMVTAGGGDNVSYKMLTIARTLLHEYT